MDLVKKVWIVVFAFLLIMLYYSILFPLPLVTIFSRYFALAGFFLLCISLIVGPLAVLFPKNFGSLIRPRKNLGLLALLFILIHYFIVIIYYFAFDFSFVTGSFQMFIALIALFILFIAGVTSMKIFVKTLGFSRWKLVQRGVYLAFILSFIHFILDLNGWFLSYSSSGVFVNILEVLLILLGIITIILQISGFLTVIKRKRANEVC